MSARASVTDGRESAPTEPASSAALIVIAKAPVAGRVKTRLSPPCTPTEAAGLAEAALRDTLETVLRAPAREHVLVLDGEAGPWLPTGFRVVAQHGGGLDERIAAAFAESDGPALLIGMDTPQADPKVLWQALRTFDDDPDLDAVLGPATDGGWWAMGLRSPRPDAVVGVPMSTRHTVEAQRDRLWSLGLRIGELPSLRDVDLIDDAVAVAAQVPRSGFAAAVASVRRRWYRTPAAATAVIAAMAALLLLANRVGDRLRLDGFRMKVYAPPLVGKFDLRLSPRIVPAVALGAAIAFVGPRLATRLGWRRLLAVSLAAAAAWGLLLALHTGVGGLTSPVTAPGDYLHDVSLVGSPGAFLEHFVQRIGMYTTHVRAHPPGFVLLLWAMGRLGIGGPLAVAALQLLGAAAAVPAVLLTTREVAGERIARLAAPFLVLMPGAVFWGSGDAFFLGVGAWAVALIVLATGRRDRTGDRLAVFGGLLLGLAIFLSYGLMLLAAIPLAVSIVRRRARPVALACAGVSFVVAGSAAAGFWWVEGLLATRLQYLASVARLRPGWFFVWANIAAFAVTLGPAVWVGLLRLRDRRVWLLAGAAGLAVLLADLSLLSKAEVERIWLPFAPWLMLAAVAHGTERERRGWLTAQVAFAILVQVWVISPW